VFFVRNMSHFQILRCSIWTWGLSGLVQGERLASTNKYVSAAVNSPLWVQANLCHIHSCCRQRGLRSSSRLFVFVVCTAILEAVSVLLSFSECAWTPSFVCEIVVRSGSASLLTFSTTRASQLEQPKSGRKARHHSLSCSAHPRSFLILLLFLYIFL